MTRIVACGDVFDDAVAVLGLERVEERPDVVLVDLRDAASVARACSLDPAIPRIGVADPGQSAALRALGLDAPVAPSADAAALGPLLLLALPASPPRATRTIVVTAAAGGVGRTLLVAHLALRLAAGVGVVVLDATGTGAAGWWLGLEPGPWTDLEGLTDELTSEHLAVVAAEQGRLRVVGGASAVPSVALVSASLRAAGALGDVVVVDAPLIVDERARAVCAAADRILFVAADERVAALPADLVDDERTWLLATRARATRLGRHAVMRCLPDDPGAVRAARKGPSPVRGPLARAYDDLAELIALDAT